MFIPTSFNFPSRIDHPLTKPFPSEKKILCFFPSPSLTMHCKNLPALFDRQSSLKTLLPSLQTCHQFSGTFSLQHTSTPFNNVRKPSSPKRIHATTPLLLSVMTYFYLLPTPSMVSSNDFASMENQTLEYAMMINFWNSKSTFP